jgi:uncharacterized protein (TIRG00374 family)
MNSIKINLKTNQKIKRSKNMTSLYFFVRALVSLILLIYLLTTLNLSDIYTALKNAEPFWLFLTFLLLGIGKLLTGSRWQTLLAAVGIRIPLMSLIGSLFVGQFFNNLFPSTIGGDTVRAYDTAIYSKNSTKALAILIMDRLIGVLALALLALLAVVVGIFIKEGVAVFVWLVLAIVSLCLFAFVLLFSETFLDLFIKLMQLPGLNKLSQKLAALYKSFHLLKEQKRSLLSAFVLSIVLQINVILHYYFISLALDLKVSLFYYFIIIPIALIFLLAPVSINGIGLRENVYIFLFGMLAVTAADATALSWIAFGMRLSQGVIGGLVFAIRGVKK